VADLKESQYNIWVQRENAAYVFNGISGALLRVPIHESRVLRAFLANGEAPYCSPKLLKQMAIGRMLVRDDTDELKVLAQTYESSRHDTSRLGLTIITSLGCNFDCPYCFEAKHPSIMEENVQQAVLQILDDQLPKISSFHVSWFGGEPLVGKQPLLTLSDAFIQRCDRAEVYYSSDIITNGYLLDEETCAQLRDRRVGNAQVTLDGPPEIHDRMRPLAGGRGSFRQIVRNLHHAINYLDIIIRVNVDTENFGCVEQLLKLLAAVGFAGKLTVYPGQIVGVNDGVSAPSATYKTQCFTNPEFAQATLEFGSLAAHYGFSGPSLPQPTATPCTAVRANELVVGSKGELYKCWQSVGNHLEVTGHINDYQNPNGRLQRWLKYNPFANAECRSCIALPVCMGGCAHHAMDPLQYENRCGTFRHTYREQVLAYVEAAEQIGSTGLMASAQLARRMETR
jgi:uncharacterized protein